MNDELFEKLKPSFESVLLWKNRQADADYLIELVQKFSEQIRRDTDVFYDKYYNFCYRAISLLNHYGNARVFEDVFYIYEYLCRDGDEVLEGLCSHYLENLVTDEHRKFLYGNWLRLNKEFFDDDDDEDGSGLKKFLLLLLLKSGHKGSDVLLALKTIIHSNMSCYKGTLAYYVRDTNIQDELKNRLMFIAPMIKYLPHDRLSNPYLDEWIEISEPYLAIFKGISFDEQYEKSYPSYPNNDQSFIISILGHADKRVSKMVLERLSELHSSDDSNRYIHIINKRDELMAKEFLNILPENVNEWLNSPFLLAGQREELVSMLGDFGMISHESTKNKVGRNDPCPCGSGKKYKKCCLG
ncbi:MAG: hypothetical protein A2381_06100 [Bdellovibrionales bacterium RIFOXYB1_FULL_37_110]|nr:MAG: hypothetical protein A2417_04985 [Bdellovibrionales bacterium RIFOXYC1_FULL_37_79]OFZ59390.1 MAG: hypothetical protein A2381_06100 [Bdellovibrionales bacterium RIFOXYB1_FULL_37_110]OFZ61950.1 MAG: hypothetical protein A2577_17985 [Bdellovibrionales bacterium RIFOXYD1_FULL_36_51]